ncbi:MAG TPA: hypothetical protein VF911_07680, partial [Thermoanaerobaculia bacterium]
RFVVQIEEVVEKPHDLPQPVAVAYRDQVAWGSVSLLRQQISDRRAENFRDIFLHRERFPGSSLVVASCQPGAALLVICFQRPLGVDAEGIALLQWLVCASFLLDLPITRYYFPRPRFPRSNAKGKASTGCRRLRCACRRRDDDTCEQ